MEIWQAIVLGAVQGFAEFLPVSSSGHLILFQHWFGITENVMFYSVMLHVGTLIPVVAVLWKEIISLFKRPFNKFWYLVLATVPAGVVGLVSSILFDLDALFSEHVWLLAITFLFTAAELLYSEYRAKKYSMENLLTVKNAFVMGVGQAVGVFPGISRSGTTVSAGCLVNVDKTENANFTFLMSIPIILAAVAMEGLKIIKEGSIGTVEFLPLAIGVLTAAVTGYIAVKFMLSVIRKANYKWFSLYLTGIAVATLITAFV